jgi:hypothetical protein
MSGMRTSGAERITTTITRLKYQTDILALSSVLILAAAESKTNPPIAKYRTFIIDTVGSGLAIGAAISVKMTKQSRGTPVGGSWKIKLGP